MLLVGILIPVQDSAAHYFRCSALTPCLTAYMRHGQEGIFYARYLRMALKYSDNQSDTPDRDKLHDWLRGITYRKGKWPEGSGWMPLMRCHAVPCMQMERLHAWHLSSSSQ